MVTEDWRYRMITPPKGNFESLPINAEAAKAAEAWDPAKDEAAGNTCQAYAAPTIMREPGRARIAWANSGNALRVELDSGQQTRVFNSASATPPAGVAGWQGFSQASWEYAGRFDPLTVGAQSPGRQGRGGGGGGGGRGGGANGPNGGALKVVTTHLRAGYLRKNGVPFSADAVVTEYSTCSPTWTARLAHRHDERPRSEVPPDRLHHQLELQEGAERLQVESAALHREVKVSVRSSALRSVES